MATKFTLVAQNGYVTLWYGKSRIGVLRHMCLKPEVVATRIGDALRLGQTLNPKEWSRTRPSNPKSYSRCNAIFGIATSEYTVFKGIAGYFVSFMNWTGECFEPEFSDFMYYKTRKEANARLTQLKLEDDA